MFQNLLVFLALLGVGIQAQSSDLTPLIESKTTIRVTNFWGEPTPDTFVLVGTAQDVPFKDNWSKTAANGQVTFDQAFVQNQPITLVAMGHPRITYLNQSGTMFNFRLPPPTPSKKVEIAGKFSNWFKPSTKGMALFGLFIPFIEIHQLFSIQMADLMSTTPDYFSVVGQKIGVPSNLVLPNQTLNYGIIPITVEKSSYRLPVQSPSVMSFSAIAGEMPFKEVADIMKDKTKSPFDAVNLMAMRQFGTLRNKEVKGSLPNTEMNLSEGKLVPCIEVSTHNNPEGLNMVSIAMVRDNSTVGNAFQVTDLKKVEQKPVRARCIENDKRNVSLMNLGVGYHKEGGVTVFNKGMSGIVAKNIQRDNFIAEVDMNSYFKVPDIKVENSGKSVIVGRPETKFSPTAEGIYAIYSDVTKTPFGDFMVEDVRPKWVVFGYGETPSINLPELPPTMSDIDTRSFMDQLTEGKGRVEAQRWEAVWLGVDPKYHYDPKYLVSVNLGYDLFETMTHAARNSVDF